MKNFKKVLALVLVLASLMGLATVAGATEYKDADKISADYTEAVKVLDLIETMQGYPNGEFRPTATITREEAAKLIAIFDNKDAKISTYYTSINPFADEKGRWGESYVGYGYRAGIIAGMNATTFAPTANVTGTQFLKMALVTLGYDQEAEGFVGSSWAVNVLSLARKLDLIDGLADGWKAEKDLTREEAAQILLNTLNADTVEYAQEAKTKDFKPGYDKETKSWTFKGKAYLTVAGAVKTGDPLYKEFKLTNVNSSDAFYRPYTKWVYDKNYDKTIEVMKTPKATFTTEFSACELLVALGIKENDKDTEIVIDHVYCDGVEMTTNGCKLTATPDNDGKYVWHHTNANCQPAKDATWGAQGTLTQVFKTVDKKDAADGRNHYIVCSIETWLGKVTDVTKVTTSRDNHIKKDDAVQLHAFVNAYDAVKNQELNENNAEYCLTRGVPTGHCDDLWRVDKLSFDDPTGLAKDDYVLITYSWRNDSEKDENGKTTKFEPGVQTVDVTEGKEARLTGYKFGSVAKNPSQTRVDSEYVKDAVHFHEGYNLSKTNNYGTYTFFYDAYGNVIGLTEGKDISKYAVLDKVYIKHEDGVAVLYADVVGLDAKVTTKAIVKNIEIFNKDGYSFKMADLISWGLSQASNGENFKDFYLVGVYDTVLKLETNSKNEYSLNHSFKGASYHGEDGVKIVKGKPVVTFGNTPIKTNSETQYLVRTGNIGAGEYEAFTGYKNVKSMMATGYEIVMDDDNEYAEVVYVYGNVAFTDGKVTAYVANGADMREEEVKEDVSYYVLTVYIDGVETDLYINAEQVHKYFDETNNFTPGFYKFQYKDIDEVTIAEVVLDGVKPAQDFKLAKKMTVVKYNGESLQTVEEFYKTSDTIMGLADDCAFYSIRTDGTVVKEDAKYADNEIENGTYVYVNFSDDNADDVDLITAIYVVENFD